MSAGNIAQKPANSIAIATAAQVFKLVKSSISPLIASASMAKDIAQNIGSQHQKTLRMNLENSSTMVSRSISLAFGLCDTKLAAAAVLECGEREA